MDSFEDALRTNTALTKEVKQNTDEIVSLFQSAKGFIRFMGMLGTVAKWVTKVGAAVAIGWAIFRYGVMEILKDIHDAGGKG